MKLSGKSILMTFQGLFNDHTWIILLCIQGLQHLCFLKKL